MTEGEAKTKWCPFAREFSELERAGLGSYNRYMGKPDEYTKCLGSECMAWRWTDPKDVAQKDRRGCCGLAGRP